MIGKYVVASQTFDSYKLYKVLDKVRVTDVEAKMGGRFENGGFVRGEHGRSGFGDAHLLPIARDMYLCLVCEAGLSTSAVLVDPRNVCTVHKLHMDAEVALKYFTQKVNDNDRQGKI